MLGENFRSISAFHVSIPGFPFPLGKEANNYFILSLLAVEMREKEKKEKGRRRKTRASLST